MSGILTRFHLDGRPIRAARTRLGALPYDEVVALESFPARRGDYSVVLDGHIDNASELSETLEGDVRKVFSSPEDLILAAYCRWGFDCPRRMLGDFAFILRDRKLGRIFCARDPIGAQPLYYFHDARTFVAGSDLRTLLAESGIGRQPNEGMVAEYLSCALTNDEETLWKGIYRLPPGWFLAAEYGSVIKKKWFEVDISRRIEYRSDAEYAENLLGLLNESVQCRLQGRHKPGVLLSGGVDSSSIAAVAASAQYRKPETYSMTFPELPCDESTFIQDLNSHCGLQGHGIQPSAFPLSWYSSRASQFADLPDYPNGAMCDQLRHLALTHGTDILLTGLGGDEWLMGSHYHYADLLRRGKIVELARQLHGRRRAAEGNLGWRSIVRFGIVPLLPQKVQRFILDQPGGRLVPDWIEPEFARRTDLEERLRAAPPMAGFPTLAQEDIYAVLISPWRIHALEMEYRSAAACGVEQRHPLSDRRILEFALAIPDEQRWNGVQTKFALREAMRGLIPEGIRLRRNKAEFSPVFMQTFELAGGRRLFDSPGLACGWINPVAVRRRYWAMENSFRAGNPDYARNTCPLWMILGLDLWRSASLEEQTAVDNAFEMHKLQVS